MKPARSIPVIASFLLLPLFACQQEDVKWEMGREAVGGVSAHQASVDTAWGLYRDDLVRSLDRMTTALRNARGLGNVADRGELNELTTRIARLRGEFVSELDVPEEQRAAARQELKEAFRRLRIDVDAALHRLDYNPDEIAAWQDDR